MKPLSILTVDDQALFREGLTLVLNKLYPTAKVKQASSGPEAFALMSNHVFDLMLLDIGMPGMNGMEVAKQVMLDHPSTHIIILTQYNGEAMITHLVQAGVRGFLLKNSGSQEIKKAIDSVLNGKQYITTMIHPSLLKDEKASNAPSVRFSKREADILMYLKLGKSSKEIAERLSLKENTINSYREDMLRKTQTSNVAELISYAYKNGVLG